MSVSKKRRVVPSWTDIFRENEGKSPAGKLDVYGGGDCFGKLCVPLEKSWLLPCYYKPCNDGLNLSYKVNLLQTCIFLIDNMLYKIFKRENLG